MYIRQRNDKYRMEYMYKGLKYSKTIPVCSKTALEKEKARFIMEVENKNNPSCIMFDVFVEKWLNEYAEKKCTEKTVQSYNQYLNTYILPFFNGYKLVDINGYELTRFFNTLTHLTTTSMKRYRALLSIIFNTAVKWEYLDFNPITKIDLPRGKESTVKASFLTPPEIEKLINCLDTVDIKYQVIILLALKCGLRRSEILGISWNDIDFENKTISIRQAVTHTKLGGTKVKTTKNTSSKRTIYISSDLLEKIKLLPHKDELIFGLLDPDAVSRYFKKFIDRNELKKIRFHDLRHTHATILIANNINIKTVSARLGHSQISTTLNIYTHSLSEEDKKASELI